MSLVEQYDVPVDLVELGCTVFALNLDGQTDADAPSVLGGIVVQIDAGPNGAGEVERIFTTATPWRRAIRFDVLHASDVRQTLPPNTAAIRGLLQLAARVVADTKRIGTDQARCIRLQADLMEIL
jgi:hypothetical protein